MQYIDRVILFMDLLGFKEIVDKTSIDNKFLADIYEVLQSITSDPISAESFNIFDRELLPKKLIDDYPHKEERQRLFDSTKELVDLINVQALQQKAKSSMAVTHFSDSLVLSTATGDETGVIAMLELAAKVSYRLWQDYGILTRGGVALGKLIHEESGVLIGPAMVRAYELESTLSDTPRILIDENCAAFIKSLNDYPKLIHLFKPVLKPIINKKKGTQLKSGLEMNLATCYTHFQHGPFSGSPLFIKRYDQSLKAALPRLYELKRKATDARVIKKIEYIINELEIYSKDYPFWDEL